MSTVKYLKPLKQCGSSGHKNGQSRTCDGKKQKIDTSERKKIRKYSEVITQRLRKAIRTVKVSSNIQF